ncbi:MAG: Heparinase family protein [Gemmatimonadetes bacterium]|nr:Heparinase family protein [Gemmatimonadota bacterium]
MSLLLSDGALSVRREVAGGALRSLAASLAADLEPLLTREIYFPTQKALLSREGGRCARDGTLLDFDPFNPHEHRCPKCGTVYRGELHDRFWIYWYQLWLAERAVHAAVLSALDVDPRFGALASTILHGYADRYDSYPNADNVLGPTRLFFSTYLESIWLLQLCVAADLVTSTDPVLADRVRDRIIVPSRAIIAEYDEGGSNRQVWNNAALLAAARVLGDERAAEDAVYGTSGIATHLGEGLLPDGTWYEGENYHLFAHRGLWYGVTMAERAGLELPPPLVDRFQRGFATPFATALPDFTLPSRRDSQYAISLRQWRIAEHCELGLARADDSALIGALQRLYEEGVPRRDTGRRNSSADVERNAAPSALSRADLSWRALLYARPVLPPLEPVAPRSALLEAQGIAVFRRDGGQRYVALDYGHSGGGHGHPDRLNLLAMDGATRWLEDFGTGSYTDPSLHWYRSTLAHNAPLFSGKSQQRVNGSLEAYDERGAAGWIIASADGLAPDVRAERTIVVLTEYLIDELEWRADNEVQVDLPFHADVALESGVNALEPAQLLGGTALDDGFQFIRDTLRQRALADVPVHGRAKGSDGRQLELWSCSDRDTEWWRAVAPGPPGRGEHAFRVIRARGAAGRHQTLMAWSDHVAAVKFGEHIRVEMRDGSVHTHKRTESGWQIELVAGSARSSIELGGYISDHLGEMHQASVYEPPVLEAIVGTPAVGHGVAIELGERHYRRSEQTWIDAGRPSARIVLERKASSLAVGIEVAASEMTFAPASATNRYDNEQADINGDGVQLYLRGERGLSAWVLVPDAGSTAVRARQIEGWDAPHAVEATWGAVGRGYRMDVTLAPAPDAIDVIINEMPRGRERRRGQLVMSGAAGEFVYLRGDRHDAGRLTSIRSADE